MPDASPTSFPRQQARTQRFTLGAPRSFVLAENGSRVLFVRSRTGTDPVGCLWCLDIGTDIGTDVETADERLIADPSALLDADVGDLPPAERARRERLREGASGITAFATDRLAAVAAFALSGRLFVADVAAGSARELATTGPVVDPRPDPTGRRVAYVTGRALHVVDLESSADRTVAADDDPLVSWGLAEFVAAEEMHRFRGYWWAPDGNRLLVARVDENPVREWHIGDPANPDRAPVSVRYPAAGTANADVRLSVRSVSGGESFDVEWDRTSFPYLARVGWDERGAVITVESRDQRHVAVLDVDTATGATAARDERTDDTWIDLVEGAPTKLDDGRLVTVVDDTETDTRRIAIKGEPVGPTGLQVLAVIDAADDVLVVATTEPTERHLWVIAPDGTAEALTTEPGVHSGARAGDTLVIASASMEHDGTRVTVLRRGEQVATITSYAETPSITPAATFLSCGVRELRTAVLLPRGHERGTQLPVLLDPYGGPHAARTVRARNSHLTAQWFADQGFAVVVTDGRGTPARGPAWERAIATDLAGTVLSDQVDALHALAEVMPDLDLSRVGIRGWSFGGYLAALAVLRRPDVFHAAVAGAPVTDWRLYDTHYTERYLGHPDEAPARYDVASLIGDAERLTRPLLLVHGLADDNVVAAHTLRFSSALLAAGRPHSVLPLSGVTHMTPQEVVAENLLLLQVEFLRRALGVESPG